MQIKAESLVLNELVRPVLETGLTAKGGGNCSSADKSNQKVEAVVQDWRMPIITYLKDPGRGADRNIRHLAFKYNLVDDELYRRTANDVLLKCLDTDQGGVAMGEVHEGICGTHQSAPKMKRLLRRTGFLLAKYDFGLL